MMQSASIHTSQFRVSTSTCVFDIPVHVRLAGVRIAERNVHAGEFFVLKKDADHFRRAEGRNALRREPRGCSSYHSAANYNSGFRSPCLALKKRKTGEDRPPDCGVGYMGTILCA